MFTGRTDMADELSASPEGRKSGVLKKNSFVKNGVRVTETEIQTSEESEIIGKPCGRYISFTFDRMWHRDSEKIKSAASLIADSLSSLLPEKGGILAVGLGNRYITADALGPAVCENIIVTRHLLKHEPLLFPELREVSALSPGVMGQTGMEALELVKGACLSLSPSAVIAIDALASSDPRRLGRTVQISTCGIIPGEGIGRGRFALNSDTLGVPVISLGVPTVSDACGLFDEEADDRRDGCADFFISPSDIDILIEKSAKTVAKAVNLALQGEMSDEYAAELLA